MTGRIIELDVRPYLKNKLEPFQLNMDTVRSLQEQDMLVLHTTFKPSPLLLLMKSKGYSHETEKREPEHWVSTFRSKFNLAGAKSGKQAVGANPAGREGSFSGRRIELDNRGLEPPEPMIRTLQALEKCSAGDEVIIHNDRVPMFLIEELKSLGYGYSVSEQPDGSAQVTIRKQ